MLRIGLGSGRVRRCGPRSASPQAKPCGVSRRVRDGGAGLRFPLLGTAIRLAGGGFLLWLALGALRSAWRGGEAEVGPLPAGGGFWTGLALMLLNAKAGFFWVSLTGVLLGPDIAPATGACAVLVAVLLSLLWHAFWRWPSPAAAGAALRPGPARHRGCVGCRLGGTWRAAARDQLAHRFRSRRPCSRWRTIEHASIRLGS